jgi:hypothetical protein
MCPLCSRVVAREQLYEQIASEDPRVRHRTIKVIQAYHPGWVEDQGACGPCWRSYRDAVRIFLVMKSTRRQSAVGRSSLVELAVDGHDGNDGRYENQASPQGRY